MSRELNTALLFAIFGQLVLLTTAVLRLPVEWVVSPSTCVMAVFGVSVLAYGLIGVAIALLNERQEERAARRFSQEAARRTGARMEREEARDAQDRPEGRCAVSGPLP